MTHQDAQSKLHKEMLKKTAGKTLFSTGKFTQCGEADCMAKWEEDMQPWHMIRDLSGRSPIDYALDWEDPPTLQIFQLLEYLLEHSEVDSHKQIMIGIFPRLVAAKKYDSYLMRALSDNNSIHESLFILSVKTDKEILSYEPMKIYDVYETNLANANASLLN